MKWSNHHSQWKSLKCSTWVQSQKYQNDLCSLPSLTIQYHGIIQFYVPTTNAKEAEVERFCEELQDLLELTLKRDVFFIIGDWNAKVENQEIPEIRGKFGLGVQNEAGQTLTEFCQEGHSKHRLPTTQEMTLHMAITKWSILKSDWLYFLQPKMEKLYIVSKNKTESWLWLTSWTSYCKIQTYTEESRQNH